MRSLPPGLAAHLGGGVTTLCRCWRLTRRDGLVQGFTDHDRDLAFEGTEFRAGAGLDAAEAATELGFAVGGGEVSGALVSAGITDVDAVARHSQAELLALHGVGPKAVRILTEALAVSGQSLRRDG